MTELLAPNGKPSNLTPEQYKLVREPAFVDWFGDWEKLALTKLHDSGIDEVSLKRLENGVSKVVDENGEPLVLYHGSRSEFNIFDIDKSGESNTVAKVGFWFTPIKAFAENFSSSIWYGKSENEIIYSVFLLIKNPKIYESEIVSEEQKEEITLQIKELRSELSLIQKRWVTGDWDYKDRMVFDASTKGLINEENYDYYLQLSNKSKDAINDGVLFSEKYEEIKNLENKLYGISHSDSYEKYRTDIYKQEGKGSYEANTGGLGMALSNPSGTIKKYRDLLKNENYDGIIIKNTRFDKKSAGGLNDQYVVFESNQIKLADGTNITFDGSNPDIRFKYGGRTISQTPAPKKDQIKGSDKNKEGSSKDTSSAKEIKFSNETLKKIENKVNSHNKKHSNKKITIDSAKAVVRRGMGAYSSSHRPTIKGGNPNSRVAWGLARLNAFLHKIVNGKSKSGKYSQDNDLIEELGYEFEKYNDGGIVMQPIQNELAFNYLKRNNGFAQFIAKNGKLFYIVLHKSHAPLVQVFDGEKLNNALSKGYGINAIARAVFNVDFENKTFSGFSENQSISVDEEYRRIGIATAITDFAEEKLEMKYVPSKLLTQEMQGFVNNRFNHEQGGEIKGAMKNEIIDILSKNARYGMKIIPIQEMGVEIIQNCIESNTYFGEAIKQAYENYIMIPISYEDKLFAIDKKVEYGYFSKPNESTNLKIEYRYDLKEYPFPVLFDSELINNTDFYDINEYEEIKSNEFDSEFLYRGINSEEMKSIIKNGFIKSNASLNIGEQQAETTSYAQYISQAGSYAVGFNAWYDEVTFPKPKYILKVKKEGVIFKPTNEGDVNGEVDVFGEVPIEKIDSIYEIRLGQCSMGTVEINVNYKGEYSEGSRFPMMKKVFVRKTDITTLIENYNNQNDSTMTNSNPKDTITMDIPLLIRFAELMREDIKTDVELHEVVENLIEIKDKGVLTMSDYESIVGNVIGVEEPKTEEPQIEEPKMQEGGKVQSIHSQKGDIKISLDENWYSDDTDVELVPISELIKFREFDRKVSPKYNKENSVDNINHLKFMFQKDGVKSPIIIEYSAEDNAVLVIEGNHRLNSAIDLGMEYLPARVVLRKYGKYSPAKIKNTMKVNGVQADSSNYIPSNLKPSQVGITGTMPIYAEGGIIEGRLHSECGEDGCGRKFQVGENGHVIEAERDEAVIVADAFKSDEEITIEGTPSEIASALNVIGGGKNFDKGAKIVEDGEQKELPEMKQEAKDTDVDDVIDSGSVIINRRSMADEKEYKVTGSPKQIASAINSIDGNGVIIEEGAEIE